MSDVLGDTEATAMLTMISVAEASTGMMPFTSVTIGAQEPATAVTSQVIWVPEVATMFKQLMLENIIELTVVGRLVPVMVSVVPAYVNPVMRAAGATYVYPQFNEAQTASTPDTDTITWGVVSTVYKNSKGTGS